MKLLVSVCVLAATLYSIEAVTTDVSQADGIYFSKTKNICSYGGWHRSDADKVFRFDTDTYTARLTEDFLQVSNNWTAGKRDCLNLTEYNYVRYDEDEQGKTRRGTFDMVRPMAAGTYHLDLFPLLSVFREGPTSGRWLLYNTAYLWTNAANEARGVDFVRHDKGYDRVWVPSVDTSSPVPAEWTDMTGCGAPYNSAPVDLTGPFNCSAHDDGPVFDLSTVTGSYVGTGDGIDGSGNAYTLYQALHVNHQTKSYRYDSGRLDRLDHQYTVWAFEDEGFYIQPGMGCKKAKGLTYANMMRSYGPDSMQWMGEGTITDMAVTEAEGKKVNMYAGVTPLLEDVPDFLKIQIQVIEYTDAETGQYLGMDADMTPTIGTVIVWWDEITSTNVNGAFDLHKMCNGAEKVVVSGMMLALMSMVTLLNL